MLLTSWAMKIDHPPKKVTWTDTIYDTHGRTIFFCLETLINQWSKCSFYQILIYETRFLQKMLSILRESYKFCIKFRRQKSAVTLVTLKNPIKKRIERKAKRKQLFVWTSLHIISIVHFFNVWSCCDSWHTLSWSTHTSEINLKVECALNCWQISQLWSCHVVSDHTYKHNV